METKTAQQPERGQARNYEEQLLEQLRNAPDSKEIFLKIYKIFVEKKEIPDVEYIIKRIPGLLSIGFDNHLREIFISRNANYRVENIVFQSSDPTILLDLELDVSLNRIYLNDHYVGKLRNRKIDKIQITSKFKTKRLLAVLTSGFSKKLSMTDPISILDSFCVLALAKSKIKSRIFYKHNKYYFIDSNNISFEFSFYDEPDNDVDVLLFTEVFLKLTGLTDDKMIKFLLDHATSITDSSLRKFSEVINSQSKMFKLYDHEIARILFKSPKEHLRLYNDILCDIIRNKLINLSTEYVEELDCELPKFPKYDSDLKLDYLPSFNVQMKRNKDINKVIIELEASSGTLGYKTDKLTTEPDFNITTSQFILIDKNKFKLLQAHQDSQIHNIDLTEQSNRIISELRASYKPDDPHYFGRLKMRGMTYLEEESLYKPTFSKFKYLNLLIPLKKEPNEYSLYNRGSFLHHEALHEDKDMMLMSRNLGVERNDYLLLLQHKIIYLLKCFKRLSVVLINNRSEMTYKFQSTRFVGLEFHVYIRGLVEQPDSGAAYISIVESDRVLKTWIWKHVEIKHFMASYTRCWIIALSTRKYFPNFLNWLEYVNLISLTLLENSWGLSRIYKVYKYLCINWVYDSSAFRKTFIKFNEECDKYKDMWSRKRSFNYLLKMLNDKYPNFKKKSSLCFEFNQQNFLYEALLMNLCPKETIGKRRHRVKMTESFIEEIELAGSVQNDIYLIHQDFKQTIEDYELYRDVNDLKVKFKFHLQMIDDLSNKSNGRFTFSPIAVILIYPQIANLFSQIEDERTAPKLMDLLTSKSSFCSIHYKDECTAESVYHLMAAHCEETPVMIAYSLLSASPIDLTYRMFDKEQVGGDREISVLSSEFRILQSITEEYCAYLGRKTGLSYLDSDYKLNKMRDIQNLVLQSDLSLSCSIDQTRWGPNFNTCLFSYMLILIGRFSNSFYLPAITCALAEQKIFQVIHYPELISKIKTGYTLPGVQGSFHMGEGIFHYTSTLYHCLVQMQIQRLYMEEFRKRYSDTCILRLQSMITSDDVATVLTINLRTKKTMDKEAVKMRIKKPLSQYIFFYKNVLKYFSIKTSDYKNRYSYDGQWEFNSIFINKDSIVDSSLKFIYSLINPVNHGTVTLDINNAYASYMLARSSGLNHNLSTTIAAANLSIVLSKWKRNGHVISAIIEDLLKRFSKRPNLFSDYLIQHFETDPMKMPVSGTYLKFKTRSRLKELRNISKLITDTTLNKFMAVQRIEDLIESRRIEEGLRRSFIIPRKFKKETEIVIPTLKISQNVSVSAITPDVYANLPLAGLDIRLLFSDPGKLTYSSHYDSEYKKGFNIVKIRELKGGKINLLDALISSYEQVSQVDYETSDQSLMLHLLRDRARYKCYYEFSSEDIQLRYLEMKEINDKLLKTAEVNLLMYSNENTYHTTTVISYPARFINMVKQYLFKMPTDDLINQGRGMPDVYTSYYSIDYKRLRSTLFSDLLGEGGLTEPVYIDYEVYLDYLENDMLRVFNKYKDVIKDDESISYLNFDILVSGTLEDLKICLVSKPETSQIISKSNDSPESMVSQLSMASKTNQSLMRAIQIALEYESDEEFEVKDVKEAELKEEEVTKDKDEISSDEERFIQELMKDDDLTEEEIANKKAEREVKSMYAQVIGLSDVELPAREMNLLKHGMPIKEINETINKSKVGTLIKIVTLSYAIKKPYNLLCEPSVRTRILKNTILFDLFSKHLVQLNFVGHPELIIEQLEKKLEAKLESDKIDKPIAVSYFNLIEIVEDISRSYSSATGPYRTLLEITGLKEIKTLSSEIVLPSKFSITKKPEGQLIDDEVMVFVIDQFK
jgi:hypothetical protein